MYSNLQAKFKVLVEKAIDEFSSQDCQQINLTSGQNSITNWPEYNHVVSEIENYPEITSHFNCYVGANYFLVFSGPGYIQKFVLWCIRESIKFDEDDFNKKFGSFVNFFNANTIEFTKECNLYNFKSTSNEINLNNEIIIRHIPIDDPKNLNENGYEVFSDFGFRMVQRGQFKKLLISRDDLSKDNFNCQSKEERIAVENFDRVIEAIRVHKASACYRGHRVKTYYSGFCRILGESTNTDFYSRTSVGKKYEISEEEVEELKTIWEQLKNTDKLGLLSSKRLSYVSERRNIEDKLIDCFVGLESLYLPDGNAELTFRLSLRVAKMINEDGGSQKDLFKFIKNMYDKRSKVAHGRNVDVSQEEHSRLENILRLSVKRYIFDKSQFSEERLNDLLFI